ncbi:MAG: hypothetical protein IIC82_02010 [Chloroflexi bacterium]|nr:hypothetical protein [Chloroflexota bacterium]
MFLEANGPFNLAHTLESGQSFRWRREPDGWFVGIVGGSELRVREAPGGAEFSSRPQPEGTMAPIVRSYLRLDDDLSALYERWRDDVHLTAAVEAYRGLRLIRQEPWECLVSFVLSIHSNIPRIARHMRDLCRSFGAPIPGVSDAYAFPTPGALAEVGEAEFRQMGLGFRARFLDRISRDILGQRVDLMGLRHQPVATAREALMSLFGVGEKVADCVLAFSLDQPEAFPVDIWVRRAVQEWYFKGQRQTDKALRLWAAKRFGREASYAQQYLFHHRRLLGKAERVGKRTAPTG